MKNLGKISRIFRFTPSERRAILLLFPMIVLLGIIVSRVLTVSPEETILTDTVEGDSIENEAVELFEFDPNTATLHELCRLGISQRTAAGIIKYRESGKVFRIKEDFAACYGITLETYERLEPYIVIGEKFRLTRRTTDRHRSSPDVRRGMATTTAQEPVLFEFDPDKADSAVFVRLGFSPSQAAVILKYRASIDGFRSPETFRQCYVVSDAMYEKLAPFMVWPVNPAADEPAESQDNKESPPAVIEFPVNVNTADSALLVRVHGIGPVTAGRIVEYRERLGGFHDTAQIKEVRGVTDENYFRMRPQIFADPCDIQKIDINFATHKILLESLGNHPYMTEAVLKKLLKNRQLKGGWSTIEDMVSGNIIDQMQAARLAPYLVFNPVN